MPRAAGRVRSTHYAVSVALLGDLGSTHTAAALGSTANEPLAAAKVEPVALAAEADARVARAAHASRAHESAAAAAVSAALAVQLNPDDRRRGRRGRGTRLGLAAADATDTLHSLLAVNAGKLPVALGPLDSLQSAASVGAREAPALQTGPALTPATENTR